MGLPGSGGKAGLQVGGVGSKKTARKLFNFLFLQFPRYWGEICLGNLGWKRQDGGREGSGRGKTNERCPRTPRGE